jgi:hypothetical protein
LGKNYPFFKRGAQNIPAFGLWLPKKRAKRLLLGLSALGTVFAIKYCTSLLPGIFLPEYTMKQFPFFFLLALAAGGILYAQTPPASSAVNGTLELKDGRFYLKSGSAVYYVRGLEQRAGSIAGLKDGAQVTLEGSVSSREGITEKIFFPVKLTLNGKVYDVTPPTPPEGSRGGRSGTPPQGQSALPPR